METYYRPMTDPGYRRRRLMLIVLAISVAAFLLSSGFLSANAATQPVYTASTYHTVTAGDTLWSIATTYYPPSEDTRINIEVIRKTNGLKDYRLQPGMRLEIPVPDPGSPKLNSTDES